MMRPFLIAAAAAAVVVSSSATFAEERGGSPAEAKAMLERAIVAVKENKTKALALFNNGVGAFTERDLYVFCNKLTDGEIVAIGNPNAKNLIGQDVRTIKDAAGKNFGQDIFAAEQKPEGQISEVTYLFPTTGSDTTPVPKLSFVTKAGDLGCGVGYYKY
jgi:Single Cache domain 2